MNKTLRILLVAGLAVGGLSLGAAAQAQGNEQEGDNESNVEQSGAANSGDAVGGQIVGVVSSGDASVDATSHSEDVDIETGDSTAVNEADSFTGQLRIVPGLEVVEGENDLEGDNSTEIAQAAEAASGDGVGGQVIGVVTSAGGSADVVAANTSEDVDIETGNASADNDLSAFTGQLYFRLGPPEESGANYQDGDNDLESSQSASASTGDGVGGQVLGIVSAGDASVDATNQSVDVDIETGDAFADNFDESFTGQLYINLSGLIGGNDLEGDNSTEVVQDADATSGDGVGGQVIGAVTSAGGSADVVAANTSSDVDIETGDAFADNELSAFTGQLYFRLLSIGLGGYNYQDGDNDLEASQSASASTGDGVGGQVLGIVSAGDASVDATNESTDVDIETGDAFADNFGESFTGQLYINLGGTPGGNDMEGDNSSELSQDAVATSGDAVGGQVAGIVTSAGGSADLVLANTSEDIDAESGVSEFVNEVEEFVGQQAFIAGAQG
ncbi:MAG: hypothetical protein WD646_14495 [Actinomycetota bacterium]